MSSLPELKRLESSRPGSKRPGVQSPASRPCVHSPAFPVSPGLVECFVNRKETRKLQYTHYNKDSKAYVDIVKNYPCPGTIVEKLKCIGHIQKRVGNRLCNLRNTIKATLEGGKTLRERACLTDKTINKIQNHYGFALLQSTGTTV